MRSPAAALLALAVLAMLVVLSGGFFGDLPGPPPPVAGVPGPPPPPGSYPLLPPRRFDAVPAPEAVVSWEDAPDWLGHVVRVEGRVSQCRDSDRVTLLCFAPDGEHAFQGVIFASGYADYPQPPAVWFAGREVAITGRVGEYRGQPQIVIEHPGQVERLSP